MKYGLGKYLNYLLFSHHKYGHGIHSPFVYDLIRNAFNSKGNKKDFELILALRRVLISDKGFITRKDFGSGNKNGKTKVADFVKNSSVTPRYGKLLYNLAAYLKPETILELGTAAGISSSYLAMGNPSAKMVSIEGCIETAQLAQNNFNRIGLRNITLVNSPFDEILQLSFFDLVKIDMAFFDGNHLYEPTLRYFSQSLPYASENAVFIFDDIHGSEEMEKAWNEIRQHEKVSISIDLFRMGLVFFRKGIEKQHFIIRY
ncbi:MAG: SAM-dependent methyltransferase [Bacteroidetes bacterium HGW-Bacteroidetes-21]|nr:MAG: SAM-dependent methyltransferase [Bacteroidetes bacterium HGW-Bacteroidetes-21]